MGNLWLNYFLWNKFNFVRSGYVELPLITGTLRNASQWGNGWSSCASSINANDIAKPSGYLFAFNASAVLPSRGPGERYFGFPLRCLSTVLDIQSGRKDYFRKSRRQRAVL